MFDEREYNMKIISLKIRTIIQLFAFVVLTFLVPMLTVSADMLQQKPNILYINVDDLGWTDLSYQGSTFYQTPHIDKLASQGMIFTNAYAPATNCSPSRACCLTGQYTPRHGVYTVVNYRGDAKDRKLIPIKNTPYIKDNNLTIAHVLRASGYRTCTIGKWHISNDPLKNGFDVNIAGGSMGDPEQGYYSPYRYPNCEQKEKGEYLTDRLTKEAIRFITANKEEPFFLYLAFYTVHIPLQAKPDKQAFYAKKRKNDAHNNPAYAAMIESLDENVGQLMDVIERFGIAQNTFILFTSDNGGVWEWSKQWPLRAGKGSYYEGGIRVPMVVRWPGKTNSGSVCNVPVSGIDFFPTFLEVAGSKKPPGKLLDGVSLIPLLTQSGPIKERPLFWHFPIYLGHGNSESRDPKFRTRPGSVIRLGDWKLHQYFEDAGLELYNLKNDIGEKVNLVDKEPGKVKELQDILTAWRKDTGAPVPRELNPKYKP